VRYEIRIYKKKRNPWYISADKQPNHPRKRFPPLDKWKAQQPTHSIETPTSHLSLLPAEETLHALLLLIVFYFLHDNACLLASGPRVRKDPPLVSSTGQGIGCIEALSPGVA
jgi:hypothetical protein